MSFYKTAMDTHYVTHVFL